MRKAAPIPNPAGRELDAGRAAAPAVSGNWSASGAASVAAGAASGSGRGMVLIGQGAMPGDHSGPRLLNRAMGRAGNRTAERQTLEDHNGHLLLYGSPSYKEVFDAQASVAFGRHGHLGAVMGPFHLVRKPSCSWSFW